MIRIREEADVINDEALRKRIIEEISGPENRKRKEESYRRHLCYKDKTSIYVAQELLKQFDADTVREMSYSISNISLSRKIIDKLARVYSNGVQRKVEPASAQNTVDEIAKVCEMNKNMKRANRYLRAHRNTIVGVLPCPYYEDGAALYDIKVQAFQPHLYDVIENSDDRERPMFVILSNFRMQAPVKSVVDPAVAGRGMSTVQVTPQADGKDQLIADKKEDENAENEQYIWWSKRYHFTTNGKGQMLPQGNEKTAGKITVEDIVNPIQDLPFVNFAIDQEGSFWAEGGDDIFDGAVKVNCMITNVDHIGVTQGYGQFFMKGKNLPRFVKAGPNKAILLEVESKDDPDAEIGFASSSPKLQELKEQIVMYVALLLTTNNLSTRAVATELGSSSDVASGIALIIDKSDSTEDVQDQRDIFQTNEPEIFKKIQKWQGVYKNILTDKFKKHMLPNEFKLDLKFADARPIMSEKEKLEVIQLRKDIGINTMIELLMMDDPSLTEKQAEERLLKIMEEKIQNQLKVMTPKDKVDEDGNPIESADEEVVDPNEDPNKDVDGEDRSDGGKGKLSKDDE